MNEISCYTIPGTTNRITVEIANIFDQKGAKIIHCPRTFETHPDVVKQESLIGQFIAMCQHNEVELDTQIDKWCTKIAVKGKTDNKLEHRNVVFPCGEVCPIMSNGEVYCLAAFCKSDSIFNADKISLQEYIDYWDNLWDNLDNISINRDIINTSVPGGKIVSVGSGAFSLDQKLGIIARSYFRHIRKSAICRELRICLNATDADNVNFEGWQDNIFPYLHQMAALPIEWQEAQTVESVFSYPQIAESPREKNSKAQDYCQDVFLNDLREMIRNLKGKNGINYIQFEGSKRTSIIVDVDCEGLTSYVNNLESEHGKLIEFLSKRKGSTYDRNGMYQLLGLLQEKSLYFGELNRKSAIKLCLNVEKVIPQRWNHLGDNIDNIINYVGQRLAELKERTPRIHTELVELIPQDRRK